MPPDPKRVPSLLARPILFGPLLFVLQVPGQALFPHWFTHPHTPTHSLTRSPLPCAQGSYTGPLCSHSTLGHLPMTTPTLFIPKTVSLVDPELWVHLSGPGLAWLPGGIEV